MGEVSLSKVGMVLKLLVKAAIFLSLSVMVYFHSFAEVVKKFSHGLTNFASREVTLEDGVQLPILTFCLGGHP